VTDVSDRQRILTSTGVATSPNASRRPRIAASMESGSLVTERRTARNEASHHLVELARPNCCHSDKLSVASVEPIGSRSILTTTPRRFVPVRCETRRSGH
jgi:hypothetical protein